LKWSAAIALMLLIATMPPCSASGTTSYYNSVTARYTINDDRTVGMLLEYNLVNPFPRAMIYEVTHRIPAEETSEISVSGDGDLTYTVERLENFTEIRIKFTVSARGSITYRIRGRAMGLVSGTGPAYTARLGGVSLPEGGFPYQRYIVEVQGPSGTSPFLSLPQAEVVGTDPPTVRYETRIDAPGTFDGLMVGFYVPRVFYRVRTSICLNNQGDGDAKNVEVDQVLFTDSGWQFSALRGSTIPPARMYVDRENNMHGVFTIGGIAAGNSAVLQLELVYEVNLYDPKIGPENSGAIWEVDPSLGEYLKADNGWEASDPLILSRAHELTSNITNTYRIVENIADFVSNALEYERQNSRRGALWALTNLRGDCSEFTDLFIALSRAAGIPARAVYGWGYSENGLDGHAWAEAFLPGAGWVPVDPTWRKRTGDYVARLDTVHLARCTRGITSGESLMYLRYLGKGPTTSENVEVRVISLNEAAVDFTSAAEASCELAGALVERYGWENMRSIYRTALSELAAARGSGSPESALAHAKASLQSSRAIIAALGGMEEEEATPWTLILAAAAGAVAVLLAALALARRR